MAAHGVTCTGCGTEAPPGGRFCGECGSALAPPEPAPIEPARPQPAPAMEPASIEPSSVAVEARVAALTLLSVPSPLAESKGEDPCGDATMVGVYAPSFPGYEGAVREVMGGVALAADAPAERAPEPARQHEPERAWQPAPAATRPAAASAQEPLAASPEPAGYGRASRGAYLEANDSSAGYSTGGVTTRRSSRANRESSKRAQARKQKLVLIAASLAGFVVVAGVFALVRWGAADALGVSLSSEGGVEWLVVEVPEAPPGLRVRFDGELSPLEDGRATFALEPTDVRVGANAVNIDLVSPNGDVATHRLKLEVPYRLRADAGGLSEAKPVFRVRVDAMPSAIVLLDDHVVALDAEGRGHWDFPLDEGAGGGTLEREVRHAFRAPSGEESHGVTTLVLPMAKLLIERPGTSIVTDETSIELAVGVHPEARVTIDGRPVENRGGHVVERLALPKLGTTRFRLEAVEEGVAPSVRVIEVRRVENLALEVERFVPDANLEYAVLAADPSAHQGKRVKLSGLAYHVETKDGKSDLQILARECPRGERCPIWVSYPGVLQVKPHSWVRVAGEISGAQRFKTLDSGKVVTVPRIDAAFVVQLSR